VLKETLTIIYGNMVTFDVFYKAHGKSLQPITVHKCLCRPMVSVQKDRSSINGFTVSEMGVAIGIMFLSHLEVE